MNTFAILIGLGPFVGWGLYPTIASKIGGKPENQILGSTIGTFIFALIVTLSLKIQLPVGMNFVFSVLSGIGWASAQIITFQSFTLIGSSRAMPISTALQLIVTSLWGVLALGDGPSSFDKTVGSLALILIICGAWLTVWTENKSHEDKQTLKKAILLLVIGQVGYWAYSAAPQAAHVSGLQAFLPQATGMVLVSVVYAIFLSLKHQRKSAIKEKISYKHIISGFFFAFAALTYLISAQPNMNGLATGFILSQTSVVLATLSGIWLLGQNKAKREMFVTVLGLVLIVVAASMTVLV